MLYTIYKIEKTGNFLILKKVTVPIFVGHSCGASACGSRSPEKRMSFPRKWESRNTIDSNSDISGFPLPREQAWIPASAGMTLFLFLD